MGVKILHIIKSLGRGGAEMLLPETLKVHDKGNFTFHYAYFLPWKDQMVESLQQNGGKVICFRASNNLHLMSKLWKVAKYVKENEIQLIHAHLPWAGVLAKLVGLLSGIPVIYTEHNKQERYHHATRTLNLLSMNLTSTIVAVSEDVQVSLRKYKPNLKVPIKTICNGVNIESFTRQAFDGKKIRETLGIPEGAIVIGTIAVFRFQKRLDIWMKLASKILMNRDNVHFIIVGDGPLRKQLLTVRERLGLRDRVHMPGLETEVRPYLAAIDIYMMCSIFEGLPVALLEAMAMGCAIVTTDAGGIREVIRHNEEGLVSSVDEFEKLTDHACKLLDDRELRLKLGAHARARVIEHYSIVNMVRELEDLYRHSTSHNGLRNVVS